MSQVGSCVTGGAGRGFRVVSGGGQAASDEQGDGQAAGGDLVAAAAGDALDDLVGAEPAQVVADLPAGHFLWRFPELGCEVVPQVAAGEAGGPGGEGAAGAEEGLDPGIGESHPGDAGGRGGDDRAGEGVDRGGSVGWVVADAFGAGQAPAGCVADLGQCGEVSARAATTWCCPNNPVGVCGMPDGC